MPNPLNPAAVAEMIRSASRPYLAGRPWLGAHQARLLGPVHSETP